MAHGLSCSAACGIFPDQGSNPYPLHWQADSQPLRHQGSPQEGPFLRRGEEVTSRSGLRFHRGALVIILFILFLDDVTFQLGRKITLSAMDDRMWVRHGAGRPFQKL